MDMEDVLMMQVHGSVFSLIKGVEKDGSIIRCGEIIVSVGRTLGAGCYYGRKIKSTRMSIGL